MHRGQVRDEGLRRVSSVTRWVAAAGVAGTAVLAGIVYKATPGRASASTPATGANGTVTDPNNGGGFQAPSQTPAPVQQVPVVRSGGS